MSITVKCSGCGHVYCVREAHAGKRARCRACGAALDIPAPSSQGGAASSARARSGAEPEPLRLAAEDVARVEQGQSPQPVVEPRPEVKREPSDGLFWARGRPTWLAFVAAYVVLNLLVLLLSPGRASLGRSTRTHGAALLAIGLWGWIVGHVWIMVLAARRERWTAAQMQFFLPWAWLGFMRRHWPDTRRPSKILAAGILLTVLGGVLIKMSESSSAAPSPATGGRPASAASSGGQRPAAGPASPSPSTRARPPLPPGARTVEVRGRWQLAVNYTRAGDPDKAAWRALRHLPGVVPETILIPPESNVLSFSDTSTVLSEAEVRAALERAGFEVLHVGRKGFPAPMTITVEDRRR